jgi:hypothetical protein
VNKTPIHDESRIDQSWIDLKLGSGEHPGNIEIEMDKPVSGNRPAFLWRVPIFFTMRTIDLTDDLSGYTVIE